MGSARVTRSARKGTWRLAPSRRRPGASGRRALFVEGRGEGAAGAGGGGDGVGEGGEGEVEGPMPMPTRSCGWSGSGVGRSVIAGCRFPWVGGGGEEFGGGVGDEVEECSEVVGGGVGVEEGGFEPEVACGVGAAEDGVAAVEEGAADGGDGVVGGAGGAEEDGADGGALVEVEAGVVVMRSARWWAVVMVRSMRSASPSRPRAWRVTAILRASGRRVVRRERPRRSGRPASVSSPALR